MTAATRTNTTPATEPTVVCKFCNESWSIVHQFVQVQSRPVTVSATGELTDEMTDEWLDGDGSAGQDEWYCRECNARSTNRDAVAHVVNVAPDEEPTGPLFDQVRKHSEACPQSCDCWS
jgi:ubiquitin C-terminal hydrolase